MSCPFLRVPVAFLEALFGYLFHSVLPDVTIWGRKASVVLEPICLLQIEDMTVSRWTLVDEWVDDRFEVSAIRSNVAEEIEHADGSVLEQVLRRISSTCYELGDNPLLYPGPRLERFVTETLPKHPNASESVDGVCHSHPTGSASLSEVDQDAMMEFANVMQSYGKNTIVGLVIARGEPEQLAFMARGPKSRFVRYMMEGQGSIALNAVAFHPGNQCEVMNTVVI